MSDFECLPIGTAARLTQLEAEVERLRALLKSTVDLAEYWINREERRGMSEGEWRTWHSLGYGSNTMISAHALLAEKRAQEAFRSKTSGGLGA